MDANALADRMAARSGLPRNVVDKVLDAFTSSTLDALSHNEDVCIPGFGVWSRPTRNHGTPAFMYEVDPVPTASLPARYHDEGQHGDQVHSIAEYLRRNRTYDETLGLDVDLFPSLPPALHPGVVTREDLHEYQTAVAQVDPDALAAQVIDNLRSLASV